MNFFLKTYKLGPWIKQWFQCPFFTALMLCRGIKLIEEQSKNIQPEGSYVKVNYSLKECSSLLSIT